MKTRLSIVSFIVISLLLASCQIDIPNKSTTVNGSGKVITENRTVSNFKSVIFSGMGDVSITQGETEALTIQAEDNIVPLLKTEVKDDTLTIGLNQNGINIRPTQPIKYTLTVKALDNLRISGAGNVNVPALKTEKFALKISGAGNIKLDKLEATDLTMTLSGAGNASVSGQVTSQTIELTGLGNYGARDLNSQTANILLSGAGNATVWAQKSLEAKISGFGSVNYYGSPEVIQKISGAGNVKNLGSQP